MYRVFRATMRVVGILLSFGSFGWFVVASSVPTTLLSFGLFVLGVVVTIRYWSDR